VRILVPLILLVVAHVLSSSPYSHGFLLAASVIVLSSQLPNGIVLIAVWERVRRFAVDFALVYALANLAWNLFDVLQAYRIPGWEQTHAHRHFLVPLILDSAVAIAAWRARKTPNLEGNATTSLALGGVCAIVWTVIDRLVTPMLF